MSPTEAAVIDTTPAVAGAGEPPSKKLKGPTGFEDHSLNISHAVMKCDEGKYFSELADAPVCTLQGIGPKATQIIDVLKIHTVSDLANWKCKFNLFSNVVVVVFNTTNENF